MNRKFLFIIYFAVSVYTGNAQIGGETTYQFLELTNSARIAALGGTQIALSDTSDLNLPFHNPALLHPGMHNQLLVNYVNYFMDVNYGYASFARSFKQAGTFAIGVQYINYGEFKNATEQGDLTGTYFKAAEYAGNIIYSNSYGRLRYGATLKPVFSIFESYRSMGLASDLGITYRSKDTLTHFAVVARNLGRQITTYYEDGNREPIPFNLQAGISKKLKHAPLIFSLTMQHLTHWDLAWSESDRQPSLETWNLRDESFFKQIMRHTVLGMEILPTQNFSIRAGYNYQRRQELKFDEKLSTVGLSLGFGLKIKRFQLNFATSRFHLAGSSNLFSLAINLNDQF